MTLKIELGRDQYTSSLHRSVGLMYRRISAVSPERSEKGPAEDAAGNRFIADRRLRRVLAEGLNA